MIDKVSNDGIVLTLSAQIVAGLAKHWDGEDFEDGLSIAKLKTAMHMQDDGWAVISVVLALMDAGVIEWVGQPAKGIVNRRYSLKRAAR
jgi:hypothetical protein